MTELMWKNKEDRLQIIKGFNESFGHDNDALHAVSAHEMLETLNKYLPWMISRVELLEKKLKSKTIPTKNFCPGSLDGKHLFDDLFDTVDMRPTGNLLVCMRAKCTKCGYKE